MAEYGRIETHWELKTESYILQKKSYENFLRRKEFAIKTIKYSGRITEASIETTIKQLEHFYD